jgi:hypothetical protein
MLKQYDQPTTVADDTAPGEEVEAPPGEEPDEQPVIVSSQLQLITQHVLTAHFILWRKLLFIGLYLCVIFPFTNKSRTLVGTPCIFVILVCIHYNRKVAAPV